MKVVRKKVPLERLLAGNGGGVSPTMRGLLIGNDAVAYEDSDVALEVQNIRGPITADEYLRASLASDIYVSRFDEHRQRDRGLPPHNRFKRRGS